MENVRKLFLRKYVCVEEEKKVKKIPSWEAQHYVGMIKKKLFNILLMNRYIFDGSYITFDAILI